MEMATTDPKPWTRTAWLVVAPLAYAAVFFVRTWPLALSWETRQLGKMAADQYAQLWLHWWVRFSLLDLGQLDFLHTGHMNYPAGVDITADYICFLHALVGVPLQAVFGLIGAVNALYLLAYVFSAMGVFLLARYLTRSSLAAFLAGLLVMHNPYFAIISYLNTELFDLGWMALFLLFLIKATRGEGRRSPLYAGLFLALTSLASMEHGLFMYLFFGLHLAAFALRHRSWELTRPFLRRMAVVAVVFALVVAPYAVVVLSHFSASVPQSMDWLGRADISEPQQPVKGKLFVPSHRPRVDTRVTVGKAAAMTAGFALLVLALALLRGPPRLWEWLAAALVFWGLSAGHEVLLLAGAPGSEQTQLDTLHNYPYMLLLDHFPLFWRFSWPNRMVVVAILALCLLLAHGVAATIHRAPGRRWLAAPLLVLASLTLLFLLPWERPRLPSADGASLAHHMPPRLKTSPHTVEPIYRDLAAEPGQFAVMVLPLFYWTGPVIMGNKRYAQQSAHGRPLVNCHFPPFKVRVSRHIQLRKLDRILYDFLLDGGKLPAIPAGVEPFLRRKRIKYIVVNQMIPAVYSRQRERQLLTHWFGAPRVYGGRYSLYSVY